MENTRQDSGKGSVLAKAKDASPSARNQKPPKTQSHNEKTVAPRASTVLGGQYRAAVRIGK